MSVCACMLAEDCFQIQLKRFFTICSGTCKNLMFWVLGGDREKNKIIINGEVTP